MLSTADEFLQGTTECVIKVSERDRHWRAAQRANPPDAKLVLEVEEAQDALETEFGALLSNLTRVQLFFGRTSQTSKTARVIFDGFTSAVQMDEQDVRAKREQAADAAMNAFTDDVRRDVKRTAPGRAFARLHLWR
jgi:hypothetical protein